MIPADWILFYFLSGLLNRQILFGTSTLDGSLGSLAEVAVEAEVVVEVEAWPSVARAWPCICPHLLPDEPSP